MSKQVALAARKRAGNGKGEARSLRRQGRVPAITYGAGVEPTAVSVDALELYHALHTDAGANVVLRLDVDGDVHLAMPREIHRHPVRREVLHVDFVAIDRDKAVHVDVPVHLEGDSVGVSEGGVLEQQLHSVAVEVLPLDVPEALVLDVADLAVNEAKRAGDLTLPAGVTLLTDPEEVVVTCTPPAAEAPAEVGEEAVGAAEAEAATEASAEATGE